MHKPKIHITLVKNSFGWDFSASLAGRPITAGWISGKKKEVLEIITAEAQEELARRQAIKESLPC